LERLIGKRAFEEPAYTESTPPITA
jgi:hypothetical protein